MNDINQTIGFTLGKLVGHAIKARERGDGRPFMLAHFVTHRCMCKCASCLWRHNDWPDVPTEDLKRFYSEAAEEGFVGVAMSGGEPFLRKDLGELVRHAKEECGFTTLVFNTGWFLRDRMDDVLPYLDMMMVSFDSAKAERHDEVRGRKGLFHRAVEGIELARSRYPKLPINLNCCVQKGVQDEVDGLLELATRLGSNVSFDVITESRNAGDGASFTETSCGLPLPELQEVCADLVERKRAGAPIVNSERYFQYFADGRKGYRCHFPKICMSVDGRGNIEDCLNLNQPIANLQDMPVREILQLPRFHQLRCDAEQCSSCSSPTMVDMSHVWENPQLLFQASGQGMSLA